MAKTLQIKYIKINEPNKILKIYKNKQGLRGTLVENGKKVSSALFYTKDGDATYYRVKEYFGFNGDYTYCIE